MGQRQGANVRVTEYFSLSWTQPSLDFIDVDVYGDTPLFIDPQALRSLNSEWGNRCVFLLQSFFSEVLSCISSGDEMRGKRLLSSLREPNETHLGLSSGRAQGRGMGADLAELVWTSFTNSEAATSGLLQDLEDSVLFVPGIGNDIVSDITTNIIRAPLIEFTQDVCRYYGIPMQQGVTSGRLWNGHERQWESRHVTLPKTKFGPIILTPKSIARSVPTYDPGEYYRHYILTEYQRLELAAGSALVQTLKRGDKRVTKKAVERKHFINKSTKQANVDGTIQEPSVLAKYRINARNKRRPLTHDVIADRTNTPAPDWDALLADVFRIAPGKEAADDYHRAVEALLTPLFFPSLDMPVREHQIHSGRKRIDINYTNVARLGFFHWLHDVQKVPCSFVPVECKNFSKSLKNPEFDQLAGRFSVNRGQFGILCHRGFGDKPKLIQRARDAALDGRGYVVVLDDDDLERLVAARKEHDGRELTVLLQRFQELI